MNAANVKHMKLLIFLTIENWSIAESSWAAWVQKLFQYV